VRGRAGASLHTNDHIELERIEQDAAQTFRIIQDIEGGTEEVSVRNSNVKRE